FKAERPASKSDNPAPFRFRHVALVRSSKKLWEPTPMLPQLTGRRKATLKQCVCDFSAAARACRQKTRCSVRREGLAMSGSETIYAPHWASHDPETQPYSFSFLTGALYLPE